MDLFPSLSPSSSFLPLTTAAARPADDDVAATSDCHVDSRSCSSNVASSAFISRLHSQTDAAAAGSSAGRHSKAQRISDHWTAASSARTVPLFPFMTGAQLEETKLQALIYRFIASGQRPPAMYMQALSKTTAFNQVAKCLQTSTSAAAAANLEPYRCRRTDGKKWRCSRDVVPDQKYCERHLNRGRSNSRKPQQPVAATPRGMPIRAGTSTSSSRSSLTTTMGNVDTSPKVLSRANNSPPSYNFDDIAEANREFSRICSTSGFQQPASLGLVNPVESKINPECNLGSLDLVQGSKFDHHKLHSNPVSFASFRSPGFDFLPLTIPRHDWKEPDAIPAVQASPSFAPDPELPDKPAAGSYFTRPPFEFCDVARWGGPLAEALRFPLSNFEKSSYDNSNFEKAAFEKSNLEKSSFNKCSLLTGCSSNCTSQREWQSESSSSGSTSNNFSTMGPLSKLATPHVSSCSSS